MSRMLVISLTCLGLATVPVVQAAVYQCARDGQITFSDIPCSSDAKPMALNVYTPSPEAVEQAANQTREIEQSLANGQKQRQAEALRTEIEAKKQKMNNEMTQITENKARSRNVSAEMQSVTTLRDPLIFRDSNNSKCAGI
ncbi:DUF4124 domain-containing protein [Aeromonas caviae]|uniref:DUF4124 domain-containing protein n=1 Tax=Aeromonas caviae TaxID=648 RepID=UPI0011644365|nr:DUF4124 domain-containing protein [Aeromonas caviae]QDO75347.1 DUF4124 domain-containing protein [Aeromonas caviae]